VWSSKPRTESLVASGDNLPFSIVIIVSTRYFFYRRVSFISFTEDNDLLLDTNLARIRRQVMRLLLMRNSCGSCCCCRCCCFACCCSATRALESAAVRALESVAVGHGCETLVVPVVVAAIVAAVDVVVVAADVVYGNAAGACQINDFFESATKTSGFRGIQHFVSPSQNSAGKQGRTSQQ